MPMLIPGKKLVVIENIATVGPITFTDPAPQAKIVRCSIRVRPPMLPLVDFSH